MPRPDRFFLLLVIALGPWAAAQEDHPSVFKIEKHVYDSDYDSWTEPYREMPLLSYWYDPERSVGGTDPAMLKVVIVEGDDQPPEPKGSLSFGGPLVLYGSSVSVEGRLCSFFHNAFGFHGGGYPRLPDDVINQLKDLAANLPDDHRQLPPKGRRVVIQTMYTPKVAVYDRANLPAQITTILRLTDTTLHPLPEKGKTDDSQDENH